MEINTAMKVDETVLTREMVAKMVKDFDEHCKPRTAAEMRRKIRANSRWVLDMIFRYARHMELSPEKLMEEMDKSGFLSPKFRKTIIRYIRRFGIPGKRKLTMENNNE